MCHPIYTIRCVLYGGWNFGTQNNVLPFVIYHQMNGYGSCVFNVLNYHLDGRKIITSHEENENLCMPFTNMTDTSF